MLEKGFSKPTARIERLKKVILDATPYVESERAVLLTESYRETEDLPIIMRRAKALEKIFNNLPVTIRDDELIVGAICKHPRSTQINPEFSYQWVEDEFDTMATRAVDPFVIPEETKKELHEAFKYWKGKTTSELASSYMSQETRDCMAAGVFDPGNYYFGGIGHVCVDYGKVLKEGFRGIIMEVAEAMQKLDLMDPKYIKKRQFYEALIITYNAAINFAHRYAKKAHEMADAESNGTRKAELLQIAKNCERVPENGATNFYEALQSFWFVQFILQIESSGHSVSPGRFDQYMYPYFANDKSISKEFAQELLDCLWVKFNDLNKTRDKISAQAFAGFTVFQNIGAGGQNEDGEDATNEMSYMMIEACGEVRMPAPSFSIRVWQGTPDEFLYRACELVRLGLGMPAMYNDEVIIPALENRGVSLKDARNYCLIGCVEPQSMHKTDGWHDAAFFNMAKVLEITFHNGKVGSKRGELGNKQLGPVTGDMTSWKSMDDFYKAFRKQVEYFIFHLAEADNCIDLAHMQRCPLPFESALVDDCIKRGLSVQEGGAVYNFTGPQEFGVADCGDSIYAMKKFVFDEKKITPKQLKDAMDANFGHMDGEKGCESASQTDAITEQKVYEVVKKVLGNAGNINLSELQNECNSKDTCACGSPEYEEIRRLLDSADSYGNDIDEVDDFARRIAKIYCEEIQKYRNPRGGQFHAGIYPVSANVLFGKDVCALPDGRLAHAPLADGVSPRQGKDTHGPTAALNSVAKLDHFLASNGTLLNQKFLPSALAGEKGLKTFASLIRSYFDHKGMHVQFNVVDRETLLEAQKHPDQHRDLIVRVAGYSAQFVVLAKEVQDDIISRTEQTF